MKKSILLLSLLFCTLAASAQVAFGIKAGFVSSLGFDESWDYHPELLTIKADQAYGFDAGIMLRAGYLFYGQ